MGGRPPKGRNTWHRCAAFMCAKSIPWDHAFCARRWNLLPELNRLEVSSTFNRERSSRAHVAAMRRAIDKLAKQGDLFTLPVRAFHDDTRAGPRRRGLSGRQDSRRDRER